MKLEKNQWMKGLLLTGTLMLGTQAYAQGSRGGGQIVRTQSGAELRDLVDPGMCTWTPGSELYRKYPEIDQILKAVQKYDWYFGFALKREIQNINYCMVSTELVRPRMDDGAGVLIYVTPKAQMVGIRMLGQPEVYVQNDRLNELTSKSKALFFIHEAMHSFLDLSEPGRQIKLMRTVNLIAQAATGTVSNDSFRVSLERNHIQFPISHFTPSEIQFLEYALSNSTEQAVMLKAGTVNVAGLMKKRSYSFAARLIESDQSLVSAVQTNPAQGLFGNFCGNPEMVNFLTQQSSAEFNISVLCLAQENHGDQSQVQMSTQALSEYYKRFYEKLGSAQIAVRSGRVNVSSALEMLATNPTHDDRTRHVLDLRAITQASESKLNAVGKQYIDLAIAASELMPVNEWVEMLTRQPNFKSSMSGSSLIQQVKNLQATEVQNERSNILNIQYLQFIHQSFLQTLVHRVFLEAGDDESVRSLKMQALVDAINAQNLGFTVQNYN